MITTNNRKIITRLSFKILRANPLRNLAVICAVVLTTLLITSIFTMTLSLNKSVELTRMKTVGTDFHGSFKHVTPEQIETLKNHPSIQEYSVSLNAGNLRNEVFRDSPVEVKRIDEAYARHGFISFIEGRLPAAENEVVLNTWVMDKLGIRHALGQQVQLDIDMGERVIQQDFIVSGYYEADKHLALAGLAFVSEAWVQENVSGIDPVKSAASGSYVNTLELSVMFRNSFDIEKKLDKVLADTGVEVPIGINWGYTASSFSDNLIDFVPYLAVILIIMLSGYLLIYNIFYISVVRDVKFYGLLKAIGTTPKQLKRIITVQSQLLYLLGLPFGLAAGYGIGRLLTPLLNTFSSEPMEAAYSASPWIFIGAAIFAYVTVWIAASKPGRMAARIAPVEAVRFTGVNAKRRRKKRSKRGGKLYSMAFTNLFRNKKKLSLMLTSLSLSMILFSIIFTVISSLDVNKYLSSYISGDVVIRNNAVVQAAGEQPGDPYKLSEAFSRKLAGIDGVKSVEKVYYTSELYNMDDTIRTILEPLTETYKSNPALTGVLKNDFIVLKLYGIDDGWYSLVQKDVMEGHFDPQKFASGNYVLVTQVIMPDDHNVSYYHPGDHIEYKQFGKSYEVMAVLNYDALYAATTQAFPAYGYNAFFPSSELTRGLPEGSAPPMALSATLHIDPAKLDSASQTAKSLAASSDELVYKSREDYTQELSGFIRIFQIVGYGLSFVIALIGVLNYINTVVTGVITRRNEFTLLESIGMTKRQLKKMLIYEGLYNVLLTTAITSTLGVILTYSISKSIADSMAFTVFRMSWLPFILVVPVLAAIAYTVTLSSYRMLSKASIVERLRQTE
ncbi:ABC transporter permease [Paenibacillus tianjinensis]|uniref:FtsX-like permease family protein n=1 Tax=Paenibacillus tianjinensis TaxID=2810347 RepID=A0ABX7L8R8_9BACL|nr:FtsX-like permease family protein [Paenibacillus tianjinensis]QSF44407.1 FtsX-like permease family protein [Paenibacillus tianjinensis]